MKTAIVNIGTIVTGDLKAPFADGDGMLMQDGRISAIGTLSSDQVSSADVVIDAAGTTAIPGLIDSHVHITFGDYTPRQRVVGYLESYVHGGTTTSITASEVHVPGRPKDPAGVKALALAARACFLDYRPGGMRVHAGSIILEPGLTEADLEELVKAGSVARQGRLRRIRDTIRLCALDARRTQARHGHHHAYRRLIDPRLIGHLGRTCAEVQSKRLVPRQWRTGGDAGSRLCAAGE
jgi:hypothetical protein